MLKLTNLNKRLGELSLLKDISLEIPKGEIVALMGESGSGKTSLLKAILGLIKCDSGSLEVNGMALEEQNLAAIRLSTGYLPQGGVLFPHLNVEENITLLAETASFPKALIPQRLIELLSLAKLDSGLLKRYPSELSGGQGQRVALLRALFLKPKLLLLDEPLSALDQETKLALKEDLKAIFQAHSKTALIVTHDPEIAKALASRVLTMREGKLLSSDQLGGET